MVFHGYRLIFHGSRLIFHGSGWVFHGSRSVFMGFHGSMLVFLWYRFGFSRFFSRIYPLELYPGLTIQSRSAARRAAQDLVVIKHKTNYDKYRGSTS